MFKNLRSILVFVFLFCLASSALAQDNPDLELDAARAKSRIANLGTGKTARVKIKMRDKSNLKGFVSEAKNEGFVLTNEKPARKRKFPIVKSNKSFRSKKGAVRRAR